jgi:hypothetical protein
MDLMSGLLDSACISSHLFQQYSVAVIGLMIVTPLANASRGIGKRPN